MITEERDRSIGAVDEANERVSRAQRDMLAAIAEVDRIGAWKGSGARDTAHWLAMRYGISVWKAHRWVGADGAEVWTTPEAAHYRAEPSPGGADDAGGEPEPDGRIEAGAQTGAELEGDPRESEPVDHAISTGEVVPERELVSTVPG